MMLAKDFWTPLNVKDVILFGSLMVTLGVGMITSKNTLDKLTSISEYTYEFTINSDKYHAQVTGEDFVQGKPVNNKRIMKIRSILEGTTPQDE